MEFFLGLFVGFAFLDFIILLGFFGIGIFFSEIENAWGFAIALIMFLGIGEWLLDWNVFEAIMEQPLMLGVMSGLYLLLGGVYTLFVSWPEWLKGEGKAITRARDNWKKETWNKEKTIEDFFESHDYSHWTPFYNKATIVSCMVLWIFDAVWKAISKPVTIVSNWVYEIFAKSFTNMGKRVSRKILDE